MIDLQADGSGMYAVQLSWTLRPVMLDALSNRFTRRFLIEAVV
jgi:hypothetical protein